MASLSKEVVGKALSELCLRNRGFVVSRPNLLILNKGGIFIFKPSWIWEPARPLQGSLGPSGPEMPKSLENVSWGLRPGPPKKSPKVSGTVWEVSRGSPGSVWRVFLDDFLETFSEPQSGGFGRHFRDFFGISGPEGPNALRPPQNPCKSLAGLEMRTQHAAFFERKRPKRKPWHRGKSLNRKKRYRNALFER